MSTGTLKFQLIGTGLAFFSAASFALNMVLASFSYGAGANIHALNLARGECFLLVLLSINLLTARSLKLPLRVVLNCYGVGLLLAIEMYVLLAAVQSISVGLAVLLFFTYPILIAIYRWLIGAEPFSLRSLLLMLVAFGGLVFVLLNATVTPALSGVLFSMLAAVVMAVMLVSSEKQLNNHDQTVVLFHVLSMVGLLMLVIVMLVADPVWPADGVGWLGFAGSTFFYVTATFSLFMAVSLIGPLRMGIIDNTAPVWAMLFGYLILGETFTVAQTIGALLVVVAVMMLQGRHTSGVDPQV